MTRRVLFRAQAEAEVLEARKWYEQRRAGLGAEFGESVTEIISRIIENPLMFPRIRNETRRAILWRFPYAVYFRLLDEEIIVLAVHGRQHPQRWQSRR